MLFRKGGQGGNILLRRRHKSTLAQLQLDDDRGDRARIDDSPEQMIEVFAARLAALSGCPACPLSALRGSDNSMETGSGKSPAQTVRNPSCRASPWR